MELRASDMLGKCFTTKLYPQPLYHFYMLKTAGSWILMITTTRFITANRWKQPKCPSAGEWINKSIQLKKEGNSDPHYNMDKP
jgi:hypothetical protein